MPGSATLDPNVFADSLISVVDDIRRDIKEGMGFRQFYVDLVTVTHVPREAGGPRNSVSVLTRLDPLPFVEPYEEQRNAPMKRVMQPCGIDETDKVKVTQVSLTYTEAELTGKDLPKGTEFYWRLTDAQGQSTCERFFTIDRPPYPSRNCCPGWLIVLRRAAEPV